RRTNPACRAGCLHRSARESLLHRGGEALERLSRAELDARGGGRVVDREPRPDVELLARAFELYKEQRVSQRGNAQREPALRHDEIDDRLQWLAEVERDLLARTRGRQRLPRVRAADADGEAAGDHAARLAGVRLDGDAQVVQEVAPAGVDAL